MKKRISIIAFLMSLFMFASCYAPSPLYGTWADNDGNKISFTTSGTFVATIKTEYAEKPVVHEGSYAVIDNVVQFSTSEGIVVNSEWDIRGSLLYITWTAGGQVKRLVLYHVSK